MARLIGVKFMAKCWEVQNTRDLADTKREREMEHFGDLRMIEAKECPGREGEMAQAWLELLKRAKEDLESFCILESMMV